MKHRKTKLNLLFALITASIGVKAQNIAINGTGAVANTSAMLDVSATNKGVLIPNVSLSTITSNAPIGASVATSLLVYNTATAGAGANAVFPGYYYWDGTKWVALAGPNGRDWALLGNAGTIAGTNFLGTTDAVDLVFRTNNIERVRILSTGNVGIGTSAPTASLHIAAGTLNTGFRFVDGSQGNGKVLTSDATGNASWRNTGLSAPSGSTQWNAATTPTTPYPFGSVNSFGPFTVPTTGWYTMQSRWFVEQNMASSSDNGEGYCWIQIDNVGSNSMDNVAVPQYEVRLAVNQTGVCPPSGSFVYLLSGTSYYVHQYTKFCQSSSTGERRFYWQFVQ